MKPGHLSPPGNLSSSFAQMSCLQGVPQPRSCSFCCQPSSPSPAPSITTLIPVPPVASLFPLLSCGVFEATAAVLVSALSRQLGAGKHRAHGGSYPHHREGPPPTQLSSLPIHFRDVATHLLSTTQAGQWGACPPAPPWLTGAPYRAQSPGWKVPRMLMGSRGVGWGALWSLGGCWVKVRGARAHPDASFQSISLWPGSWGVWEGAHHSDREFCIQPPGVCSPAVSFLRA